MSSFAQQLIASLHEAAAGDFTRFTIQGQVWVRHDVGSPEHQLSEARSAIADMTTEIDVLRSECDALREALRGVIKSVFFDTSMPFAPVLEAACAALEKKGVPNE